MTTPNSPYGAPYGTGPVVPQNPYGQEPYAQEPYEATGQSPYAQPQPAANPYGGDASQPAPPHAQEQPYGSYAQSPQSASPSPYAQPSYAQPSYAQPSYAQPPYAQQAAAPAQAPGYAGQAPYPVEPPTNTMSIVSMVCAFFFAPAGLVCGIVALSQIKRTGEKGRGLAIAGVIVSAVNILIAVLAFVFMFAFVGTMGHQVSEYSYSNGGDDYGYSYDYTDPDTSEVAWLVCA